MRPPAAGLLALAAALAAAAAAQHAFLAGRRGAGWLALLAAFGLCAVHVRGGALVASDAPRSAPLPESALPSHPLWLAVALGGLAAALVLQAAGAGFALQLLLWALGVAALLAAWRPAGAHRAALPAGEAALAAALVVVALAARLVDLQDVPGGIYGDEGEFGLVAVRVLEGAPIGPFASDWDRHATLFAWIQAGAMAVAGTDVAGLRLASALAGGLTALPVYLLGRGAFGPVAAASAALLLAASPWHGHLTRLASNNAYVCLLTAGTLAALWHGARTGAARPFAVAGVLLGCCFYFGNKAVSLPATAAAALAALALAGGPAVRRQGRLWLLVPAAAVFAIAPQLVDYAQTGWWGPLLAHPARHLVRVPAGADLLAFWAGQLERALIGPIAFADASLFRVPAAPTLLTRSEGALAVVGLGLALASLRRPGSALLLAWLSIGAATSLLDARPPQSHHLVAVSPAPMLLAGVAVAALFEALRARPRLSALAPAVAAGVVALAAAEGLHAYHRVAARHWLMPELTELGRALREYAGSHQLVAVAPPIMWKENSTLRYAARGVAGHTPHGALDPGRRWFEPTGRPVVFLVDARMERQLVAIRRRYPGGALQVRRDSAGQPALFVYEVPAGAVAEAQRPGPAPPAL